MCPRVNLSPFSRFELGTPLLKVLHCSKIEFRELHCCSQKTSPQHPGVVRLHVNAFYFSTTARRVTSLTWGRPPPCKQPLTCSKIEFLELHCCSRYALDKIFEIYTFDGCPLGWSGQKSFLACGDAKKGSWRTTKLFLKHVT